MEKELVSDTHFLNNRIDNNNIITYIQVIITISMSSTCNAVFSSSPCFSSEYLEYNLHLGQLAAYYRNDQTDR